MTPKKRVLPSTQVAGARKPVDDVSFLPPAKPVWPVRESAGKPLSGVKVLDLSRVLAGPYASMLLADLGADVIKIEHPDGDATRRWGPPFLGDTAVYYLAMNRNKRSVRADLKDLADRGLVQTLASQADVIIENFRPGTLAAYDLDNATVCATNPKVVYCSITAFGSDAGQHSGRSGYDLVVQAMGGIMSITGEPSGGPVKVGVAIADLASGLYATVGILGSLFERFRSNVGHHVEVALFDAQVALLTNQAMNWLVGGVNPSPMGSDHPNVVPYRAFETSTDPLVLAVGTDQQFASLCKVLGKPEWSQDPRYARNAERVENRQVLVESLQCLFRARRREEWLIALDGAGVPCGPIQTIAEVFADPVVSARMVRTVPYGVDGAVAQVVSPIRIDGEVPVVDYAPPALGAHDEEIRLGMDCEGGS